MYDLLIIGAGPGGYVSAIYASMKGLKVGIIERKFLGGTCLNEGCIPTKSLISSAELYYEIKHADIYGIHVSDCYYDLNEIFDRKDKIVSNLRKGVALLLKKHNVDVIEGSASFKDDNTIIVNEEEYTFKNLIIATGSNNRVLNIEGNNLDMVFDSSKALENRSKIDSITIVGGGVIGLEFAFIYNALDIDVTIVEYLDRLASTIDFEASKEILRIAKKKGIKINLNSKALKIEKIDNKAKLIFEKDGKVEEIISDRILMSTGRSANLSGLNIENTSILINKGAIVVDEYMRTNVKNIYAIGDVTNIYNLAHVASYQGEVAVDNILNENRKADYSSVPSVIFTIPEIASCGEVDDGSYEVSKVNFRTNGKSQINNGLDGFVKLIKKDGVIKGATIIGNDASSLISTLCLAISNKMSEKEIINTIFAHPTTSETIHDAAYGLDIGYLNQ